MDVPMDRDYERLESGLLPWLEDGHLGHDAGLLFSIEEAIDTASTIEQSFGLTIFIPVASEGRCT